MGKPVSIQNKDGAILATIKKLRKERDGWIEDVYNQIKGIMARSKDAGIAQLKHQDVKDGMKRLEENGYLEQHPDSKGIYRVTEKGRNHVTNRVHYDDSSHFVKKNGQQTSDILSDANNDTVLALLDPFADESEENTDDGTDATIDETPSFSGEVSRMQGEQHLAQYLDLVRKNGLAFIQSLQTLMEQLKKTPNSAAMAREILGLPPLHSSNSEHSPDNLVLAMNTIIRDLSELLDQVDTISKTQTGILFIPDPFEAED